MAASPDPEASARDAHRAFRRKVRGVAFVGALVVHFMAGVGLGFSLLLFFVGWPIVGTLLTIDDDLKGGWSNPDGTVTPDWLTAPYWGQIVEGIAIASAGFAFDSGLHGATTLPWLLIMAALAAIARALLTRRWWLATLAIPVVAVLLLFRRAG